MVEVYLIPRLVCSPYLAQLTLSSKAFIADGNRGKKKGRGVYRRREITLLSEALNALAAAEASLSVIASRVQDKDVGWAKDRAAEALPSVRSGLEAVHLALAQPPMDASLEDYEIHAEIVKLPDFREGPAVFQSQALKQFARQILAVAERKIR